MGSYGLEGTIESVVKDGTAYRIILTGGKSVLLDGNTLLRAMEKIKGAVKKGGNRPAEEQFTGTLKGAKLALAIEK